MVILVRHQSDSKVQRGLALAGKVVVHSNMRMYARQEQSEFLPFSCIFLRVQVHLLTSDTVNQLILHFQWNSLSQELQQAGQGLNLFRQHVCSYSSLTLTDTSVC